MRAIQEYVLETIRRMTDISENAKRYSWCTTL